MKFKIQQKNFDGPIDVLLDLIEKRKMPVNDISLSSITDEYITFINSIENTTISNITHFIFIASTLTLIKSKSLLPTIDFTKEEGENIDDLKYRINLLKVYREISDKLKLSIKDSKKFYIPKQRKEEVSFRPHKDLTINVLKESLLSVLSNIPKEESKKREAYIKLVISLEEVMNSINNKLKENLQLNFNKFLKNKTKKFSHEREIVTYNVVSFLAILELVKFNSLNVSQDNNFDEILIESNNYKR